MVSFAALERRVKKIEALARTAYTRAINAASGAVDSVFGRTGAVVAATDDYTKEQLTGLKTTDSPQFTGIELGHATDTTLTRASAGQMNIEGVQAVTASNTLTLTNKTIDADGTGNSITNIENADIKAAAGINYSKLEGTSGLSAIITVLKTANESVASSTTVQDDDHLFFTAVANATYIFECFLRVTTTATADFRFLWVEPDGTFDFLWHADSAPNGLVDEASPETLYQSGTNNVINFIGVIRAGATGGTFKLQWAQGSTSVSNTTVESGSWLKVIRVA